MDESGVSPAVVVAIIGIVAAPVSAGVNWLLNRRAREQADEGVAVNALHQAVESLQVALSEAQKQIDRLRKEGGRGL